MSPNSLDFGYPLCFSSVLTQHVTYGSSHPPPQVSVPNQASCYIDVLPEMVGVVLGSKGATVKGIREKTGAVIKIGGGWAGCLGWLAG